MNVAAAENESEIDPVKLAVRALIFALNITELQPVSQLIIWLANRPANQSTSQQFSEGAVKEVELGEVGKVADDFLFLFSTGYR